MVQAIIIRVEILNHGLNLILIQEKDSNISTVFVPLGKKEEISRYLIRADPELNYLDKELFEIDDRDGLYYEKPNWIDKYLRRDLLEWNELCLPQYLKMYDPTSKDKPEDDENKIDEEVEVDISRNLSHVY